MVQLGEQGSEKMAEMWKLADLWLFVSGEPMWKQLCGCDLKQQTEDSGLSVWSRCSFPP